MTSRSPSLPSWFPIQALVLASALAVGGCLSNVSFVATGVRRPQLPEGARVRVYLTSAPPQPYDEIGLIEVRGGAQTERIADAQEEARRRGANALMLLSTTTHVSTSDTTRKLEVKDAEGKVVQTQDVPVTQTSTTEVDRFAALWVPAP